MDQIQAKEYIELIKSKFVAFYGKNEMNDNLEWCTSHEKCENKLGSYDAYPIMRFKDTGELAVIMNEHGYSINCNGIPHHPLKDVLGIWD